MPIGMKMTKAEYDTVAATLVGKFISQVTYHETDCLDGTYHFFDNPRFDSAAFGLGLSLTDGSSMTVTWGDEFEYYGVSLLTSIMSSDERFHQGILDVTDSTRWRGVVGEEIVNVKVYWSWVTDENNPGKRRYYPQDLLLHFRNGRQIIVSALEVRADDFIMGMMDNITIFDDLDTAREYKCLQQEIRPITLTLPFRMGSVNCYLLQGDSGYLLIDCGSSSCRKKLLQELERFGCQPDLLKLIVLTHGDFDHSGNASYMRQAFGAKIAMHRDDAGMGEQGDMFVNRKQPNVIIRKLIPFFTGFGKAERFTPDLLLEEGEALSPYGFDARVLSIPGHSKGSLGILTAAGALFCGDLLINTDKPALNSLIDDMPAAEASLHRLRSMGVKTVYPGHGTPFPMQVMMGEGG